MLIDCRNKKGVKCQASPELVENRQVLDFVPCAGTYGMGGPGFCALQLGATRDRPMEWLVCTLWGADNWMLVNGRWLAAHPGQYAEQKPWYGSHKSANWIDSDEEWDEFTPRAIGQTLRSFRCDRQSCELLIGDLRLEITEDSTSRPILYGNKEPRVIGKRDDLRAAWVLASTLAIQV